MAKTRTYNNDFRQKAVNLLLSSGRPLKKVAEELGVTANFLRTWRDKAIGNGCRRQPGEGRCRSARC